MAIGGGGGGGVAGVDVRGQVVKRGLGFFYLTVYRDYKYKFLPLALH